MSGCRSVRPTVTQNAAKPALPAVIALLVTIALALGACGDGGGGGGDAAVPGGSAVTVENCGRKLTFDKPPQRVLAVGIEALTGVVAAGAGDKISLYALLGDEPLGEAASAVSDAKPIGDASELSREAIIAAQPDVVVTYGFDQGGVSADNLETAGIETLFVSGYCDFNGFKLEGNKSAFDLLYGDIETYGSLFGTRDVADEAVAGLRARVAAIEKNLRGAPQRSAVALYVRAEDPLGSYGNGVSMIRDQMGVLGLQNVFGDVDQDFFEPSVEEIVKRDADYLIAQFAAGAGTPTANSAGQELLSRTELMSLEAIRSGRILPIEYNYTGHSPRAVEGLEKLAEQLKDTG